MPPRPTGWCGNGWWAPLHRTLTVLEPTEGNIVSEHITTKMADGVALLTIDRPPANALDDHLVDELGQAVTTAAADPAVGALVITANGSLFVAGADIKLLRTLDGVGFGRYIAGIQHVFDQIEAVPVPTIAALNGHAFGGGLELALACDLRFASRGAKVGLPEVNLGMLPGAGGTQRLTRVLGKGRAMELLYTGRPVVAEEALALGLVERVMEPDRLLTETLEFAAALAHGPRVAMQAVKRCVLEHLDGGMRRGLSVEREGVAALFASADAQEGIGAFIEKRPAQFARSVSPSN